MSSSYWNYEDDENIICPYCGKEYEPSYEDTYIGNECMAIKLYGSIILKRLTEKQLKKKLKICKIKKEKAM